uniref:Uncharacterized protein n=1 Tax=Arundo donax TaxID=35708 RepID=A0A0A8ZQU9_ARUDO
MNARRKSMIKLVRKTSAQLSSMSSIIDLSHINKTNAGLVSFSRHTYLVHLYFSHQERLWIKYARFSLFLTP